MNKFFKLSKFLISLYFLYYFFRYIINNQEKLLSIFIHTKEILISIVFFKIIIVLVNSIIFKEIVKLCGINLSLIAAGDLTILNYLGNLIGPFKLGAGMRLQYLRQNHKINMKKFLLKNFTFTLYSQIIFIFLFVITLYLDNKINIFIFSTIVIAILLSLIILNRSKVFEKKNILSINVFFNSLIFNISIITLFLLGIIIVVLEINLLTNNSYQILKGIYVFEGISFTNLINITPANLGIREFALFAINSLHGLSLENLIEIGIIDRFCSLLTIFIMFSLKSLKSITKYK